MSDNTDTNFMSMTVAIVAAYVRGNLVSTGDLPQLISSVYVSLQQVAGKMDMPEIIKDQIPAVSPKRSVFADYIICLEDGKRFKSLKRHLRSSYDLTPEAYRAKWGLGPDYPMVAPNYAAARSLLAKKIGLGRGTRVDRTI